MVQLEMQILEQVDHMVYAVVVLSLCCADRVTSASSSSRGAARRHVGGADTQLIAAVLRLRLCKEA